MNVEILNRNNSTISTTTNSSSSCFNSNSSALQHQNLVGEFSEAISCFGSSQNIYQSIAMLLGGGWGCLDLAMPLGLSNFQIYLTILAIYHLRPAYI